MSKLGQLMSIKYLNTFLLQIYLKGTYVKIVVSIYKFIQTSSRSIDHENKYRVVGKQSIRS